MKAKKTKPTKIPDPLIDDSDDDSHKPLMSKYTTRLLNNQVHGVNIGDVGNKQMNNIESKEKKNCFLCG